MFQMVPVVKSVLLEIALCCVNPFATSKLDIFVFVCLKVFSLYISYHPKVLAGRIAYSVPPPETTISGPKSPDENDSDWKLSDVDDEGFESEEDEERRSAAHCSGLLLEIFDDLHGPSVRAYIEWLHKGQGQSWNHQLARRFFSWSTIKSNKSDNVLEITVWNYRYYIYIYISKQYRWMHTNPPKNQSSWLTIHFQQSLLIKITKFSSRRNFDPGGNWRPRPSGALWTGSYWDWSLQQSFH